MGFFNSSKTEAHPESKFNYYEDDIKAALKKAPESPVESIFGKPLFYLDGIGANLFIHEQCVVLDRTEGGIFNMGNRTYKAIPLKYIVAVQIKSTGATTGFIEFATYGHENTNMKGFDRVQDEDNVNFRSAGSANVARAIFEYIMAKIVQ